MRPEFHFTAASGWINDPHGITYRDGEYHAFFQYVPDRTDWAPNCHWGHARGRRPALAAGAAGGDRAGRRGRRDLDGVAGHRSTTGRPGSSTPRHRNPNIGIGRIRVATPDDDGWISWTKGAFVADAPPDLDLIAYRDPFLREDPDGWRMFVGAGGADGTAMAFSYRSDDLEAGSTRVSRCHARRPRPRTCGWARSGNARRSSTSMVGL